MAGWMDSIGSFFSGGGGAAAGGGGGGWGNILGAASTAATIYNEYQKNQTAAEGNAYNRDFGEREFAEKQRQFDITNARLMAGGGGGGGGGGGNGAAIKAQIQANHSKAMQSAYQSLMDSIASGRKGESEALGGIIESVQRAYGQARRQ